MEEEKDKEKQNELNEHLNQLENLFSNLIIELEEINDIKIENKVEIEKGQELEKERQDIINEREVEDNIKNINDQYSSNVKRRHHFTISEKLEAINYLKKGNSIHNTAAEKYMVDRKTIKYWRDHENEFQKITNPSIKKTLHPGLKTKYIKPRK